MHALKQQELYVSKDSFASKMWYYKNLECIYLNTL